MLRVEKAPSPPFPPLSLGMYAVDWEKKTNIYYTQLFNSSCGSLLFRYRLRVMVCDFECIPIPNGELHPDRLPLREVLAHSPARNAKQCATE